MNLNGYEDEEGWVCVDLVGNGNCGLREVGSVRMIGLMFIILF